MTKIASIPGYNISKVGKDKYAVAVNNGNMGAVLLNKEQVKQLADAYGVPVKEEKSTAKKVAAGLVVAGAVAFAAVVLRKKGLKSLNKENLTQAFDTVKGKVNKGTEFVKEKLGDKPQKLGEKIKGLYNKVAEFAGKVWKKVKTFVGKVVDKFFKKKKPEAVQLEIPFEEFQKKGSKFGNWAKEKSKTAVNFFKNLFVDNSAKRYETVSAGAIRNKHMVNVADDIVKAAGKDNSAEWVKTFSKRYPDATVEVLPR